MSIYYSPENLNGVILYKDYNSILEQIGIFNLVMQRPGVIYTDNFDTDYEKCIELGRKSNTLKGSNIGMKFCGSG